MLLRLPVIPVIDLLHGQVVQARRGERQSYRPIVSPLVEGSRPYEVAHALLARCTRPAPASELAPLYVAELDAIQGRDVDLAALRSLLELPVTLWLDAGFAGPAAARALFESLGPAASRVRPVYGSESLADAAALAELATDPRAILSLDSRQARPLDPAGAWQKPALWPRTMVVMTLDRVGSGEGPDLETFARLRAMAPDREWVGGGGVRNDADLAAAAQAGAAGWLVASALHAGSLSAA
jgi:uncharacterized protein related to proFAR isomerase